MLPEYHCWVLYPHIRIYLFNVKHWNAVCEVVCPNIILKKRKSIGKRAHTYLIHVLWQPPVVWIQISPKKVITHNICCNVKYHEIFKSDTDWKVWGEAVKVSVNITCISSWTTTEYSTKPCDYSTKPCDCRALWEQDVR